MSSSGSLRRSSRNSSDVSRSTDDTESIIKPNILVPIPDDLEATNTNTKTKKRGRKTSRTPGSDGATSSVSTSSSTSTVTKQNVHPSVTPSPNNPSNNHSNTNASGNSSGSSLTPSIKTNLNDSSSDNDNDNDSPSATSSKKRRKYKSNSESASNKYSTKPNNNTNTNTNWTGKVLALQQKSTAQNLPPGVIDLNHQDLHSHYCLSNTPLIPTPPIHSNLFGGGNGNGNSNSNISNNHHIQHPHYLVSLQSQQQQKTNTRVANTLNNNLDSAVFLSSYGEEYYRSLREHEGKYLIPEGGYIGRQKGLTESMRGILIDWLVELTEEYKLTAQTLFMAVSLVDRSLMVMDVERSMLQCLGCACMLIASKFEEIHPPCVEDFVYISDNTYTKPQITKMECDVCGALEFKLAATTVCHFNGRFVRASEGENLEQMLVNYFLELMLLEYEFIMVKSSLLVASAVYLARVTLRRRNEWGQVWTPSLCHYTDYGAAELKETVVKLHKLHYKAEENSLKAVFTKYKAKAQLGVSGRTVVRVEDLKFTDL